MDFLQSKQGLPQGKNFKIPRELYSDVGNVRGSGKSIFKRGTNNDNIYGIFINKVNDISDDDIRKVFVDNYFLDSDRVIFYKEDITEKLSELQIYWIVNNHAEALSNYLDNMNYQGDKFEYIGLINVLKHYDIAFVEDITNECLDKIIDILIDNYYVYKDESYLDIHDYIDLDNNSDYDVEVSDDGILTCSFDIDNIDIIDFYDISSDFRNFRGVISYDKIKIIDNNYDYYEYITVHYKEVYATIDKAIENGEPWTSELQ